MMHRYLFPEPLAYDGGQLAPLWIFHRLGLTGDAIVAFRGGCSVELASLVDQADVRAGSPIFSEDMLHFLVEHFENDLEKAVLRQRFLVVSIAEELAGRGCALRRSGDDLFLDQRKLSVSIATITPVSVVIHTGVNIHPGAAPVPAAGLADLGLARDWAAIAEAVMRAYAREMEGVHLARCKVRGVG